MASAFLKITLRKLFKHRLHTAVNLLGLVCGLTSTMLITLWINRELSMDDFHANRDQLFRVLENQTYSGNEIFTFAATPGPLVPKLKEDFPEIMYASRVTWGERDLITFGSQSFYEEGLAVEPDFLRMLSFPLLKGDLGTALAAPNNIVITERTARKYFGSPEQAMGRTLRLNTETDYSITGVLADVPANSSFRFDYLLPLDNYIQKNDWLKGWNSNGIRTYFMTQPGLTASALTRKLKNVVRENSEQENVDLLIQAMPDWHLRSDFEDGQYTGAGRIRYVRIFSIIAVFILLIACINFMNLSTAKSAGRALEVGVRKVTGASRAGLATQFLGESLVLVTLAGLLSVGLAALLVPSFNRWYDVELALGQATGWFWLSLLGIVLFTGFVAGSYPAFFLSSFQPVKVLKGFIKTGGSAPQLRKVLVTTQFIISAFLIISTIVIYQQMELIRHKRLGYDKENLVYVPVNGELFEKFETVKTELLRQPTIQHVSYTIAPIHSWGNNTSGVEWAGKDPEQDILFQTIPVGYDFLATIGAELSEGRDFSPQFPADSMNYLVNETAAQLMGLDEPVGQTLSVNDDPGNIVGVVKDFHVGSFEAKQDPVILMLRPWKNWMYLRLAPGDLSTTLAGVEGVLRQHNPNYPFEYFFTDQEYAEMHRNEQRLGNLAKLFAFIAIFISCLGLFGLTAFATEQRRREIGIRKVLGASLASLTGLLSRDFLRLVAVAVLIAVPLAWWVMHNWLDNFAFRTELHWWIFAAAGGAILLLAFLTVSLQSTRAALANPIGALKNQD